jgi:trk system potassium uptake protein TrkH
MQLFRAEVSGPTKDKLTPRMIETARIIGVVYLGITALETVLLMTGGMDLFDALCHSFSTIATGGFSTKNASIGFYDSVFIEVVVIIFMFIGSCNFSLIYVAWNKGWRTFSENNEFVFYLTSYLVALLFTTAIVTTTQYEGDLWTSLRATAFSVMTVCSTTGFATADFALWPGASQALLILLMLLGGCAGSTAGGLKQVRVFLLIRTMIGELKKMIHPRLVTPLRLNGVHVDQDTLLTVSSFLLIYLAILFNATFVLLLAGVPPLEAVSAVAACLTNEGPGLGSIGPMGNYASLSDFVKWVLSLCMLLGRLEIFTVLILLHRAFWRG